VIQASPGLAGVPHTLASLGGSSSGRYARVELVLTVRDEEHRNRVFVALSRAMVRFVL
jgi:putative lipoic acid-binding regulatory protein